MILYKHAVRCPRAMQIFLNFNPSYWCFAPLRLTEVEVQNERNPTLSHSLIRLDSHLPTSIGSKDKNARVETKCTRSDERVRSYMRHLPPIPGGYNFSIQQRVEQFQYFKHRHDIVHRQNSSMDLFYADIIAVLPEDASEPVRRFVESLFITHTEAKLNTSGRLVPRVYDSDEIDRMNIRYDLAKGCSPTSQIVIDIQLEDREEWCLDLIFPHHRKYMHLEEQ